MTSSEEMHKEYVEQAAKNIDFVFVPASLKFDRKYCNVPELHWEQSMKPYPHDDPVRSAITSEISVLVSSVILIRTDSTHWYSRLKKELSRDSFIQTTR